MRIVKIVSSFLFFILALLPVTETRGFAAGADKQDRTSRPEPPIEGERVFRQNCARCHNAPESLPSQSSGTIIRHMRVRANLSREDERAILKFLNP